MQDADLDARLRSFLARSRFVERGAVVTDLDGTAVLEDERGVTIPPAIELGLERLYELGHPVIINTLRFPLSVIKTFGLAWYALSEAPIPVVTLNGALRGRIERAPDGALVFNEVAAEVLTHDELAHIADSVERSVGRGLRELLVFLYPRDWRRGELIWTPDPSRRAMVAEKYRSASSVIDGPPDVLRKQLHAEDLCMVFVLADAPQDKLMAYQHAQRRAFHTHARIDKLIGAERMAAELDMSLADSLGAGDTMMDRFLAGVGLAVLVGGAELPFRGRLDTLRLADSSALGDLLFRLGDLLVPAPAAGR